MIRKIVYSSRKFYILVPAILLALFLSASFSDSVPVLFECNIIKVNDGDTVTLMLNDKSRRCRLIGIDAPEIGQEPWGTKAKEHLRQLLKEQYWRVSVEVGSDEHYDKYKRLLVYLWTKDNRLINEQMVLDGYAVLFTYRSNSKYKDRLARAQKIAQEKQIGIWGQDGLTETPLEYKKKQPTE
jgi:micrococcal nuclease